MRIESNLRDDEPRKVSGVNQNGNRFERRFKDQATMDRWFASLADGVDVQEVVRV